MVTIVILILPYYYNLIYDEPVIEDTVKERAVEEMTAPKQDVAITPEKVKTPEIISEVIGVEEESTEVPEGTITEAAEVFYSEINTPLISAKISSLGGGTFEHWYLNEYDTWEGHSARIIDHAILQNGIGLTFTTNTGERVNLNNYNFELEGSIPRKIELGSEDSYTFRYYLELENTKIQKNITIYGDSYHIDLNLTVMGAKNLLLNDDYEISWINGLPSNEKNVVEEYTYSESYASMGGELEDFSIDSEERIRPIPINGQTDWIAIRTKYFLSAIIPTEGRTSGAIFAGEGVQINDVIHRRYNTSLICDLQGESIKDTYRIYMGPLDYTVLADYENGLTDLIMNHGWYETTFRPISLLILRVFKFFQLFIPNYGIVIILFSILVKIVVYPLTKKSYKSMKEMSRVQPLLTEIREKYKSDPQRMNKETMKLYKEHGINPLGGCLPMLLQLPLLGALFIVFRSTIQLRGASFIPGWIDDLSSADTIFTLPFSLPLYGDQFNILPILMAGTMMLQSKMTMQDPKQKAMVYIMPIFMLLIFNQFPSGLNLYYTMFNVLTIFQQKFTDGTGKTKKNK
ncbi:MAG: membrane protein insertase YidC [Calditrichia bacterium]|nr:membrane protein insertase YidC [Calditrichia bacterium]